MNGPKSGPFPERTIVPAAGIFFGSEDTIYKYRDLDRNAISIFVDREVYFATSSSLNDPLDSQFDIVDALIEAAKNFRQPNARPALLAAIKETAEILRRDKKFAKQLRKAVNQYTICSMSIYPDSPLMWSYYANAHSGFCAGFNASIMRENSDGFDNIMQQCVVYTNGNPLIPLMRRFCSAVHISGEPIDYRTLVTLAIDSALSTKSLAWAHEGELRLLRESPTPGPFVFEPDALTDVILGCRMSSRDRRTLLNLLDQPCWAHVRIKEAVKSPARLSLDVADLKRKPGDAS